MFADAESGEGIWVFSPRHYTRARRHTVAASRPPLSGYLERAPQFRHQQNALATEPLRLLQGQKLIKNIAFIWVSLSIETGCIENQAGIIVRCGIANNSGSRPLCCIIAAAQNSSGAHVLRHLSASTQSRFVPPLYSMCGLCTELLHASVRTAEKDFIISHKYAHHVKHAYLLFI